MQKACYHNLCKSKKSVCSSQATHASTMLPLNYSFQAPLLGISRKVSTPWAVTINCQRYDLKLMYQNYDGSAESTIHSSSGLVRRGATYMISDDLTISATNSSSTICILKKWNVDLDDIEEHVINISKTEVCLY